jgi:hypothetical protein
MGALPGVKRAWVRPVWPAIPCHVPFSTFEPLSDKYADDIAAFAQCPSLHERLSWCTCAALLLVTTSPELLGCHGFWPARVGVQVAAGKALPMQFHKYINGYWPYLS